MLYFILLNQNSVNTNWELVLSIVAIIISLIAIVFELLGNQRINSINLEARFYEKIYEDFLLDQLPNARNRMVYNNNLVTGADGLIDVLNDMRRKSLFFKYKDSKFYADLCRLLQQIEDELVRKSDKKLDDDEYCEFVDFIKLKMEEIYALIIDKYTGKISSPLKKK